MKNLCEIVDGLTGIKPKEGTVVNMLRSAAATAKSVVCVFPRKLCENSVVHSDETGIHIDGKLHWVHVVCTQMHQNQFFGANFRLCPKVI